MQPERSRALEHPMRYNQPCSIGNDGIRGDAQRP